MAGLAAIAASIEEIAPRALAGEWDNVGLLVDCGGEVTSLLVTLDITDETVNEAEALGCQLIVAHHPVIFSPLKQLAREDVVYKLVKKNISALCAHTNLDAAAGGVNDILSAAFGLEDAAPFAQFGRMGRLKEATTAQKLAELCTRKLGAHVRLADAGNTVHTLAVLGGSGGGLLAEAQAAGIDCLLTGEADHHDAIDFKQAGISLVSAGHFATEYPIVPVLCTWLSKRFPDVKVKMSRRGRDPFSYIDPVG